MRPVPRIPTAPPRRLARLAVLAVGLALAAALALPGAASAASFTATIHGPNHAPKANVKWPLHITATRGRTKLSGRFRYQFLYQGQVVSSQPGHSFKHGSYTDKMLFPSRAIGQPLTIRCIITTKFGTISRLWSVKVVK